MNFHHQTTHYRNPDLEALFLKMVKDNFSLSYIDEFNTFYLPFSGKPEFDYIKLRSEMAVELIYMANDLPEQALEIELRLLPTVPVESVYFYTLVVSAAKSSAELGRTDEVRAYALTYLTQEKRDYWESIPTVLDWYAAHYPDEDDAIILIFEDLLSEISRGMQLEADPALPLTTRIRFLSEIYSKNAKSSQIFQRAYQLAALEDKPKILRDYLAEDPLPLFRDRVVKPIE